MSANGKVVKRDGNYYVVCPHCKVEDRGGLWLVAHQSECNITFTCPSCKKKSTLKRRCCENAKEV